MVEAMIVGAVVSGAALWLIRMQMQKRDKAQKHEHCGGCGCCGPRDTTHDSTIVRLQNGSK